MSAEGSEASQPEDEGEDFQHEEGDPVVELGGSVDGDEVVDEDEDGVGTLSLLCQFWGLALWEDLRGP